MYKRKMFINALLLRQIRKKIVEICDYIYRFQWNIVYQSWKELEEELVKLDLNNEKLYCIVDECRLCIKQGNYLRLNDLLSYDIDLFITKILHSINEVERKNLSGKAKAENKEALERFHKEIMILCEKENGKSRVECLYAGTENISISILEGEDKFRLFSDNNPWSECVSFIGTHETRKNDIKDIYVLGFGGGHLIRELGRWYPDANIKVYLPNIDIFKMVISNIPVKDILINKKLELFYISSCFDFFEVLQKRRENDGNFEFYIDRQELRASIRSARAADKILAGYTLNRDKQIITSVGKNIYEYLKSLDVKN